MWHIPDEQDVPLIPTLSTPYAIDLDAIARAAGGVNGVLSGGLIAELGTPGMGVGVAAATDIIDGVSVDLLADTLILDDADATFPRWDTVLAQDDATYALFTGTPAESPAPLGALPLSTALHGRIWVPALDTAITTDQILNLQIPVPTPVGVRAWTTITANDETTAGTKSNDATMALDSQLRFPMVASGTYRFRCHMEIDGHNASGVRYGFGGPATPTRVRVEASNRTTFATVTTTAPTVRGYLDYHTSPGIVIGSSGDWTAFIDIHGTVVNGPNSGNFGPWWSQNVALAETTIRLNASYIEYEVV